MKTIEVPPGAVDMLVVASVSGGKDSTALILALREAEIPARYVFADTQWEAQETYDYLDLLRSRLGITIDVVSGGGMAERARTRAGFPRRLGRWCTEELKIKPMRAYHDALGVECKVETLSAVGVRGAESAARAKMPVFENWDDWGGYVWRPLIDWKIEDVLAIHHRHGVPVNPLYRQGHDRVGCFPCIFSGKEEMRLIADSRPEVIERIRALEREFTELRAQRNEDSPGRYKQAEAAFFEGRNDDGPWSVKKIGALTIDHVVEWSRTDRGGKQLPMFAPAPRGGCMKWGLCESSPVDEDQPATEGDK